MVVKRMIVMRKLVPFMITAIGLLLVAFMIVTEGEPGALPLALVLIGAIWTALAWRHARKRE